MEQGELFERPRVKRRRMAHVVDSGNFPDGRMCALFRCRCGWTSEWTGVRNRSDARAGIPCERCNVEAGQDE